ncbi:MAG: dimethylarginine dimethylaminohydrolase family protein, partial [Candidatus Thorarchaeota archaeon]
LLNLEKAIEQHRAYVDTLIELGLDIIEMSPLNDLPDACFVEDTVVVHGNRALMTRPNPISRRGEIESVENVLKDYFEIHRVEDPATLEGGDVIHTANHLISGMTQRSNNEGIQAMRDSLDTKVDVVEDPSIVHLKSYVTFLGRNTMIGIARYSKHSAFKQFDFITIPEREAYASNTLTVNGTVLIPQNFTATSRILTENGFDVIELATSQFERCEGALTCLSIIF